MCVHEVMVRLKCLLGGKDTVMVDWSLYNDGNGCRGGIKNTSCLVTCRNIVLKSAEG